MRLLVAFFLFLGLSHSAVIISEIMYNPRVYNDMFAYIELYNNDTVNSVQLDGWSIPGVGFTFPSNTEMEPGSFFIVCNNTGQMLWAYPYLISIQVFGPFANALSHSGQNLTLVDNHGVVQCYVNYAVGGNWPTLPDAFGASLELMCYFAGPVNLDKASYWTASDVPDNTDPHAEWGGTPGHFPRWRACLYEKYPNQMIRFSELMYNPYKSDTRTQNYEYVEIKNINTVPVDVSSWRIVSQGGRGPMRYTFPEGTMLAAGEIVTIAKDVSSFEQIYSSTVIGRVFGPYDGELPNSQTKVVIVDSNGRDVDVIEYDISGSWPRAANSLGGDNSSLPYDSPFMAPCPTTPQYYDVPPSFRYKGMSLTRRSWNWDTNYGYNWKAALPNPGVDDLDTVPLLPKITKVSQSPSKKKIQPGNNVTISINLRPWDTPGNLSSIPAYTSITMTWWTFNVTFNISGPQITVPMQFNGKDGFDAVIPGQIANTFVRYTFKIVWADGRIIIHPALEDPFRHHIIFFDPEPYPRDEATMPHEAFHLFITPDDYQHLWDMVNVPLAQRKVEAFNPCLVREAYSDTRNCTLVFRGTSYESLCRFQGSRWNRPNGDPVNVAKWGGVGPSGGVMHALSWRVDLPAHEKIENTKAIILSKLYQGCTFYQSPLLFQLSEFLGVPATTNYFARLRINGLFFRLILVFQHGGADWVKQAKKRIDKRCIYQATEDIGDVYNAHGLGGFEGPYSDGNTEVLTTNPSTLQPKFETRKVVGKMPALGQIAPTTEKYRKFLQSCPQYNLTQIYYYTYTRLTYKFLGYNLLEDMVVALNANGSAAWLQDNFDYNLFMNYLLLDSYAASWDHAVHNQEIHQRVSGDGKWEWFPWDADMMFGEYYAIYSETPPTWANTETHAKQKFWAAFQPQIQHRMTVLLATILSPASILARYEAIQADMTTTAFMMSNSYAPFNQNLQNCDTQIRSWFTNRINTYTSLIGTYNGTTDDAYAELASIQCPSKPTLIKQYNVWTSPPGPTLPPLATISSGSYSADISLSWQPGNPGQDSATVTYQVQMASGSGSFYDVGPTFTLAADQSGQFSLPPGLAVPGQNYSFLIISSSTLGTGISSQPRFVQIPQNCVWSEWQNTSCSVACGGGTLNQTRSLSIKASNGGTCNGTTTNVAACNTAPCPVDCVWSDWSAWSACSVTCGNGTSLSTRTVTSPAKYGGTCTGGNAKTEDCLIVPCPIDCWYGPWSNYSDCSTTCGGGLSTSTRTRNQPQFGGAPCTGDLDLDITRSVVCETTPCPCFVGFWGAWSDCEPCDTPNATRFRSRTGQPLTKGAICNVTNETGTCFASCSQSLSSGSVAGIVVGSVVGACLAAGLAGALYYSTLSQSFVPDESYQMM